MDILKNIIFRKLNKKDKELFIILRLIFLMDCFDTINDTDKKEKSKIAVNLFETMAEK